MSLLSEIQRCDPLATAIDRHLRDKSAADLVPVLTRFVRSAPAHLRDRARTLAERADAGTLMSDDLTDVLPYLSSQLAGLELEVEEMTGSAPPSIDPTDDRWTQGSMRTADELEAMFLGLLESDAITRWIDLGSGDGHTLATLARPHPHITFIGLDVAWSFTIMGSNHRQDAVPELPPNVRYVVLGPGGGPTGVQCGHIPVSPEAFRFADELSAETRRKLGERCTDVVSLFYPIHMERPRARGESRPEILNQLETACALLRPGGSGICVTENVAAWRAAAAFLRDHARVSAVHASSTALGASRLRRMGITPYVPTHTELDPELGERFTRKDLPYDESFALSGAFGWGLPLWFRLA